MQTVLKLMFIPASIASAFYAASTATFTISDFPLYFAKNIYGTQNMGLDRSNMGHMGQLVAYAKNSAGVQ